MIYFEIQEEYGYREWIWAYPGTPAEAFADWKAGRRPIGGKDDLTPRGTMHAVRLTWSRAEDGAFHCLGKSRKDFCSACAEVKIVEYLGADEVRFDAITNLHQFAGEGHFHEEDDTFLTVNGVGTIHDRHAKCPEGCANCWVFQDHTRTMSVKDYKCAVCAVPLCAVCSGCAETAFCAEHSVVDAIGLLEDS